MAKHYQNNMVVYGQQHLMHLPPRLHSPVEKTLLLLVACFALLASTSAPADTTDVTWREVVTIDNIAGYRARSIRVHCDRSGIRISTRYLYGTLPR